MAFHTITVQPCTPNIGAEVSNIDLTRPLTRREIEDVHAAFARYQVLFFRDQKIDWDSQVRFARLFGELHAMRVGKSNSEATDNPYVRRQHFDANSERVSGEAWHADQTCNPIPPRGSILYNHTVPPDGGGDTLFASMYAAYDALSPTMKDFLEGLTATHDGKHIFGPATPATVHPVIIRHPVTDKKILFVNRGFTMRINELSAEESDALLKFLYVHLIHPDWTVRFRWTPHSLAMWDNMCLQHRAIWDYWPHTRSGYRVQFEGDAPPAATRSLGGLGRVDGSAPRPTQ